MYIYTRLEFQTIDVRLLSHKSEFLIQLVRSDARRTTCKVKRLYFLLASLLDEHAHDFFSQALPSVGAVYYHIFNVPDLAR